LVVAFVGFVLVRNVVIGRVLLSQLQAHYHGKVVVKDWWFGLNSSGLVGVELGDGAADAKDADWFAADRISTDVSLRSLIHGRSLPTIVRVDHPVIQFRFDARGQPLTKIPLVASSGGGQPGQAAAIPIPRVVAKGGEITLDQVGRAPMTIAGVDAELDPGKDGETLKVTTDDPTWGRVAVSGRFDPAFLNGTLEIDSSPGFVATPEKIERIPFIPAEVWTNLEPRGRVDAKVKIDLVEKSDQHVQVHTNLQLRGASARLSSLGIEATDATGEVVVDGALVTLKGIQGKTIDGSMAASGTLDFRQPIPRFAVDLGLKGVDMTRAPASWQLGEVGASGRLTGRVDLRVALPKSGPDLTGTRGQAVIENSKLEGISIKSLSIGMTASAGDLKYETLPEGAVSRSELELAGLGSPAPAPASDADDDEAGLWTPVLAALPVLELATHDHGFIGWVAFLAREAVTFQVREQSSQRGFRLPRTITTHIELEDVELTRIMAKAEGFGITMPVPMTGRLSLKATATIPIGRLKDVRRYAFQGEASLRSASIDHVDVGNLAATLDFKDGVLELSDFRGVLVDHPGRSTKPVGPAPELPPASGALPTGGFRIKLRAEVAPRGTITAQVEGNALPVGELLAPVVPVRTPVSGQLTIDARVAGSLAKLADVNAWNVDAKLRSQRVTYQAATLDEVDAEAHLKQGKVELPRFAARLVGKPLEASASVDLAGAMKFSGSVKVAGWQIADVLAFVPGAPRPSPASGIVDAQGEATGTLRPLAIQTRGNARVLKARVGSVPLDTIAFRWADEPDAIVVTGIDASLFGGKITGEARIPTRAGKPLEANSTLKGVDSSLLASTFAARSLAMTGRADGRITVKMPLTAATVDAEVLLVAPALTIRRVTPEASRAEGLRISELRAVARGRKDVVDYEVTAGGLGGQFRFKGSAPMDAIRANGLAEGEVQLAGFRLDQVWRGLGVGGKLAELEGSGAFVANWRASLRPLKLWSRGLFELRDLRMGSHMMLGNLKGTASWTPTFWRLDSLDGDLFGGTVTGAARGETLAGGGRIAVADLKVERASIHRMLANVPDLARSVEGYGSVRMAARLEDSLRAEVEVLVPRARVFNLPVSDVRFPAEITLSPASGIGALHTRHWTGHLAGGSVRGNGWIRLGQDRTFQTDLQLSDVDLEILTRLEGAGKKPASGKLSGKISVGGPDPTRYGNLRGRVDLDLDDASLVELPVVRELDRFLGAARGGGLFEDGDLHGTIANKTFFVESLTLQGRLVQIHATGSIAFGGDLNLEVLVNTGQTIPQSGAALVGVIPGLGEAIGRSEEVLLRMASFLSSRLLKFRVTGTVGNPVVQIDAGVAVGDAAAGFFAGALQVSGGRDR
jgi:translocation and assembly module TamB